LVPLEELEPLEVHGVHLRPSQSDDSPFDYKENSISEKEEEKEELEEKLRKE
jgi:hypothetical protein